MSVHGVKVRISLKTEADNRESNPFTVGDVTRSLPLGWQAGQGIR